MTKPTPEQIQRACDLANGGRLCGPGWQAYHYGGKFSRSLTALAETIAELDAMQAERDKARADLGEIAHKLGEGTKLDDNTHEAYLIAEPYLTYRVETDPLVEALKTIVPHIRCAGEETYAEAVARQLRVKMPELAKRGFAFTKCDPERLPV